MLRSRAIAVVATVVAAAATAAPAQGHPRRIVPRPGDWEGVGAHRLPLSFELARRHGRLVATSIALGSPFWCPASERDAEAVSLSNVAYAGPGARRAGGGSSPASAMLSGRVSGASTTASLTGSFTSPRSGAFSIQVDRSVGCGWPAGTLTWQVHPATRPPVPDGTWSAALSGPGITSGSVGLVVAGQGRVIDSLSAAVRCQTTTSVGENSFKVSPAYEFIRPGGDFFSPETGNPIDGHPTTWSGRFSEVGGLTGALSIYDLCTGRLVQAQFAGGLRAAAGRPVREPGSRRPGRVPRRGPGH